MNKHLWIIQKHAFDHGLELDGLIMKVINVDEDKPVGCAINILYKEPRGFGRVCAGKCNCSKIHQIFNNKVVWDKNIPSKDFFVLLAKTYFGHSLLAELL